VTSLAIIGAALGSIVIGPFSDKFGRKISILIADIFFSIGSGLML